MGPSGRIGYILHILDCLGQVSCKCFIWVEVSVQRRLCPIFVRNVGSIDIHECFRGLTGSQQTPGFEASQLGIRAYVYEYLGSSGWVSITIRWFDVEYWYMETYG